MTIICYTGSKFSNKTSRVHHPQIRQFGIIKHVVIFLHLTISIAKPTQNQFFPATGTFLNDTVLVLPQFFCIIS